jgi:metallo-beta-lactamase class B
MRTSALFVLTALLPTLAAGCASIGAQQALTAPYLPGECTSCDEWNIPQAPIRLFGNTYYVGTRGLTALLITSDEGHVLIDGGIPASAPLILENVRSLGFDVREVKLLLNSHVHFDHAGGLAALRAASGARVAALVEAVPVLQSGSSMPGDPQHGWLLDFPPVRVDEQVVDGGIVRVGPLALTAYLTPGHAPGGTTWTWRSCEQERCLDFVYADSHSAVSVPDFRFSDPVNTEYVARFEVGFEVLERLPCDVVIAPHPGQASLWQRLENGPETLIDREGCRRYVATMRAGLERRLAAERQGQR